MLKLPDGSAVVPADIIIVEDDRATAQSTAVLLKLAGYHAEVVCNAHLAVKAVIQKQPRCVILDIGLPGLDGYQVATRLRRQCSESLRIIAVTGYGGEEARRLSQASGIDYHLLKPVHLSTLLTVLTQPPTPAADVGTAAQATARANTHAREHYALGLVRQENT